MLQLLAPRPTIKLDDSDVSVLLAATGMCYEHRRSGELVRAATLPVAFALESDGGDPGDLIVADEYGGAWAMEPGRFAAIYRPSCICPY
jgi:hypothetical protein